MIEELLPAEVASVATRGDDSAAGLLPEEAAELGKAIESRVREFAAGRDCARQALAKLGLPATPIRRGQKCEPVWPRGIVGSITHCSNYRAAAVAKQSHIVTLGIDAEDDARLPEGVLQEVAGEEERAWLSAAPGDIHWDRVLFSAKESLYKAWFPLTGRWLGFEDAAVTFNPAQGTFYARLLVPPIVLPDRALAGLGGRFLIRDGLVLTAIALVRNG